MSGSEGKQVISDCLAEPNGVSRSRGAAYNEGFVVMQAS